MATIFRVVETLQELELLKLENANLTAANATMRVVCDELCRIGFRDGRLVNPAEFRRLWQMAALATGRSAPGTAIPFDGEPMEQSEDSEVGNSGT